MNDWFAILTAAGGSVFTFITFWMALGRQIESAKIHANGAEDAAKSAGTSAAMAMAKCELMNADLQRTKVELSTKLASLEAVSEATARSLAQAELRLAKSIDDLGEKMDHLSETIIGTLGSLARKTQP